MFGSISDIVKIPVAVLAGIGISVLFYEGVRLPWVGQILPGIVWYRVDAATSQMVTKFERDALQAQLDQERRDREIAQTAAEKAQQRAVTTAAAKQAADARIAELEEQAKKDGREGWSKEELEWYEQHR